MGEFSDLEVGGSAAIDLTDDGWRRRIADVVEPSLDGNFAVGFGEIAKAKEIGVGGGIDPNGGFEFGGHARGLRGIKAGAGKLKNAAILKIVANDLRKKGGVGLGGVRARRKIRYGYARLSFTEPSGNSDAVLRCDRVCHEQDGRGER